MIWNKKKIKKQREEVSKVLIIMKETLNQLNDVNFKGKKAEFINNSKKYSFEIKATFINKDGETILVSKDESFDILGPYPKYRINLKECVVK